MYINAKCYCLTKISWLQRTVIQRLLAVNYLFILKKKIEITYPCTSALSISTVLMNIILCTVTLWVPTLLRSPVPKQMNFLLFFKNLTCFEFILNLQYQRFDCYSLSFDILSFWPNCTHYAICMAYSVRHIASEGINSWFVLLSNHFKPFQCINVPTRNHSLVTYKNERVNPFTPVISSVILLIASHMILMMLL